MEEASSKNSNVSDGNFICTEHFPNYTDEALEEFREKQDYDKAHNGVIFLTTDIEAKMLREKSIKSTNNDDSLLRYSVSIMIDNDTRLREFELKIGETKNREYLLENFQVLKLRNLNPDIITKLNKILEDKLKPFDESNDLSKEIKDVCDNNLIESMRVDIDLWIKEIKNKSTDSTIDTGFPRLNDALNGGLKPSRLYGIGGVTGIGKTTFVMNIADNVASSGQDVLVFSLEASKSELIAKSFVRQMLLLNDEDTNIIAKDRKSRELPIATELINKIYPNIDKPENLDTETYYKSLGIKNEEEEKALKKLLQDTTSKHRKLKKHLYIYEGFAINISKINNVLDTLAKSGIKPKLVIVDYLQVMSSYNSGFNINEKQNVDRNITELKKISIDFNTSVIVISSFNRENYSKKVSLKSFKESGSIEYSCDVMMGLQLREIDWFKSESNVEEQIENSKNQNIRKVELIILKNRMYKIQEPIEFDYYTKFDCFNTSCNSDCNKSQKVKPIKKDKNSSHTNNNELYCKP